MGTPGGLPWYALLAVNPALTIALFLVLISALAAAWWLINRASARQTSWWTKAICFGSLMALLSGGLAHWVQAGPLAIHHAHVDWMLKSVDQTWPDAMVMVHEESPIIGRSRSTVHVTMTKEEPGGTIARAGAMLPSAAEPQWPSMLAMQVRSLDPRASDAIVGSLAAELAGWAAFLPQAPSLSAAQTRAGSRPYVITTTHPKVEWRKPWHFHWAVTGVIGIAAFVRTAMFIRRRARSQSPANR
jgi:hypothetical protein